MPIPEDIVILKEDYSFYTGSIFSYSRDLVRVMKEYNLIEDEWNDNISLGVKGLEMLKHFVKFTIPKGTEMKVVCYEVKKRRKVESWINNWMKFNIVDMPGVPKAKGKSLRLTVTELHEMSAELVSKGAVY